LEGIMKIRNLVIASSLLIGLLAVNSGFAQDEQRTPLGRQVPCPHPTKLVIKGHNPASVLAGEAPGSYAGSAFNQISINKNFGYTFSFPVCPKECCLWTTAYLTVTFKALQGGPANSSTSANDDVTIYVKGTAVVSTRIWSGAVLTGATRTAVYAIPASYLSHGYVTLAVEDDTAVLSAVLTLEGCCLCVP
jgi:hypothetical protein